VRKTKKSPSPEHGGASFVPPAGAQQQQQQQQMYSSSSEDESALLMGDEDGLSDAEREFRAQCSRFLTQLGNAGGVIAGSDDEESSASDMLDPLLERAIRVQLPEALARYNAASRSLAAHLLLAVNAHYLTNSQTEEEFHNLMRAQV